MNSDTEYYEQASIWQPAAYNTPERIERITKTIESIPVATKTILDIGCGNGAFINKLAYEFPDRFERIVGLDSSSEALTYVETEKVNGKINSIPFGPKSFDLVSCLEVLEHLPHKDFYEGISEIQRLSRKYILITVPNDEILENSLVLCPKCCCAFNPCYHVRSFSEEDLVNLFPDFNAITIKTIGPVQTSYRYHDFFYFLRLGARKPVPSTHSICPQCGYQEKSKATNINFARKSSIFDFIRLFSFLKPIILKKREEKIWLLALYTRVNNI
jgi:SAM-dependent methyltransferase